MLRSIEKENTSIEALEYQLNQWRKLVKYLEPTNCDRDDVGEIEELIKRGLASQQPVDENLNKTCPKCGVLLHVILTCPLHGFIDTVSSETSQQRAEVDNETM